MLKFSRSILLGEHARSFHGSCGARADVRSMRKFASEALEHRNFSDLHPDAVRCGGISFLISVPCTTFISGKNRNVPYQNIVVFAASHIQISSPTVFLYGFLLSIVVCGPDGRPAYETKRPRGDSPRGRAPESPARSWHDVFRKRDNRPHVRAST